MTARAHDEVALKTRQLRLQSERLSAGCEPADLPPSPHAAGAARRLRHLTGELLRRAGGGAPGHSVWNEPADGFSEELYLLLHRDVAAAVEAGIWSSGRDHWMKCGRGELRAGPGCMPAESRPVLAEVFAKRAFGVNLFGFLDTPSGLGQQARGLKSALESRGIATHPINVQPWKGGLEVRGTPELKPYRINVIVQNADMLDRFTTAYGAGILDGRYNIAHWSWELPAMRADWLPSYRWVEEVWVPSEFCRRAVQSLTALPVTVIPPVVEGPEDSALHDRRHFGLPDGRFLFLYAFDVASEFERKNPLALVEAFRNTFGASRDVLLCLKYWNRHHNRDAVGHLKQAVRGARNILLIDSLLSGDEMLSLHRVADCLASPHRAEGFGFNLAESMYYGKPVIATRYSANLDFMNDENSYLIDCKLVPLAVNRGPYFRHNVWAEPSIDHLGHLLRRVFENPGERAEKGRLAAADIRRLYSRHSAAEAIWRRFQELGLDREKPPRSIFKRQPGLPPNPFGARTPAAIVSTLRRFRRKPVISVLTPVYNVEPALLRSCIESVRAQWYPYWELCLCDDGSTRAETLAVLDEYQGTDPRIRIVRSEHNAGIAAATNRAAEISTGEFLALLDNDDEITANALYEVAAALDAAESPIDFLYTDEDKLEPDGQYSEPYFKPDWSPEHLHSVMYLLHMLVIRKELFYAAGGFRADFSGAQDYDLALRATARARAIVHIPKILYHWRKIPGSAAMQVDAKPRALDAAHRAVEEQVRQSSPGAWVEPGKLPGVFRVRYPIVNSPLVSLCIPTNDQTVEIEGRGKVNLVENFVRSIAEKTGYRNFEILLCDNGNLSVRTRRALGDIPYRLVSYPGSQKPFNFAEKANFLFGRARGEHIVLLNDDLEVITAEWLEALIEFSQQPEVGAVGARLLFPNGRIQHVGVVLGVNGSAAHVYHNHPASLVGYNGFTHIIRNYLAVTGACMATRKNVLAQLGGFDTQFAIDFNDTDYCLRAVAAGYRVVYTPYAELFHFESQTAPRRAACPRAMAAFVSRWARYIERDPYYNPNLTRDGVDFSPAGTAAPSRPAGAVNFAR